jgi:hypothetical protein
VRCGQRVGSGRSCVKQRPNQPNSAAQTAVLSHIVLFYYFGLALLTVLEIDVLDKVVANVLF